MKILATADTHGFHNRVQISEADVLVVAGDICPWGTLEEIQKFRDWLQKQPCKFKIIIAGNHDKPFESHPDTARRLLTSGVTDIFYLQDSFIQIQGVTFYGSPWTPSFMNWNFMADRGEEIRKVWSKIPDKTEVLITHGPPATILDNVNGIPQGCIDLLERVTEVKPQFHIFGHIHEGYGTSRRDDTWFINASACDRGYRPINVPIAFEV